jgi:hypothetical protein
MIAAAALLPACGDDDGPPPNPTGGGGPDPVGANGDEITLSIDGAPERSFVEASGLPDIDCDPRVDWASYQLVMWHDYTDGQGPNGYELFFDIMFPATDDVGTYTVHGESLQALLYSNGVNYSASPILAPSSGTVTVTRSDTSIEGNYTFTLVDATGQNTVTVTGSFAVGGGWSLSCQ